jgi:uncharacterized protein (DUF58 family)
MQFTRVNRRSGAPDRDPRVYASLDDLLRLQFKSSGFSFLPRQPVHSVLSGRHASRLRGRGLNFEELRTYLPGDDIRSLDWKVTARTREPHVRVYTEERDRPVWLLVDQRSSMFFGSQHRMKSVTAAEAAAVAAWRVLSSGDRVGAIVFGEEGLDIVAPHRSQARVMQILRRVVMHNHALSRHLPGERQELLNEALAKLQPLAQHDCLVVLITDGQGSNPGTSKALSRLARHNDLLIAFVHDPMEAELPAAGQLVFASGPRQLQVDTSNQKLREQWAIDFADRLERMKSITRRHSVPLLPLNTVQPVLDQVRSQLGQRRRNQGPR